MKNNEKDRIVERCINHEDNFICTDGYCDEGFWHTKDREQQALFDVPGIDTASLIKSLKTKKYFEQKKPNDGYFQIQSRRYLGNKYRLIDFIKSIVFSKCKEVNSFCDIFAGTGVVGESFNTREIKIISNDFLSANYVCLRTFLDIDDGGMYENVSEKIKYLNRLSDETENYFSKHFGGTYFSKRNAQKIGAIREEIENVVKNDDEKNILLCSLLYSVDRAANTVGHYDAFRRKMDMLNPVQLLNPEVSYRKNAGNEVYREDANDLIRKISCDVLYIDPPYNSRQYSDAYHLLENLVTWEKPDVFGVAKKMDRSHIKSKYCLKDATSAFADLIEHANCKYILLSYNNTGDLKDGRSNARMNDEDIVQVLKKRGAVEIFEKRYKAFTTGKSDGENNAERIFYCEVKK